MALIWRNILKRPLNLTIRFLSSSEISLRHVNPLRINQTKLIFQLFTKLQPQQNYIYLVKPEEQLKNDKELLEILKLLKSGQDERCLEIFKSWINGQKLDFAFYLIANKNWSNPEFLAKLVKHLSLEQNSVQDMIALWLGIYFTNRLWTVEELYETLDFTRFQFNLTNLIQSRMITNAELCCIFNGMKKVQGLNLYHPMLRQALYKYLIDQSVQVEDRQSLIMTILPILQRGDEIQKDSEDSIFELLEAYAKVCTDMNLSTLVHLVNHGISKKDHVYDQVIHNEIKNKVLNDDLKTLSVNEIKKLTKYLSRIPEEISDQLGQAISDELEKIQDQDCQLTDTRDLVQSICYLIISLNNCSVNLVAKIFQAVNQVQVSTLKTLLPKEVSKELLLAVHKHLFPNSSSDPEDLERQFKQHFVGQKDAFFCRLLVNIEQVEVK